MLRRNRGHKAVITPSPALARVARGNLCAGCGLCRAVAPPGKVEMVLADGYLRPRQLAALPPDVDRLIAATCPGLRLPPPADGEHRHPVWGPLVGVRTGHASDPALRHHASSGGALSALLVHLLEAGTVDAVVQTAASDASPILNATVESRTRDDVFRAAGSRYGPSAPLADLRRWLDQTDRFAFVGKPCDVAALRALAVHDARVNARFPVMIAFFCAGVPSVAGTREILARLSVREDDVAGFRYRGDGWPGRATARARDGRTLSMSYAEAWGSILSNHVQLRCKICPDGMGSHADIVCADAWYGDDKGFPLFDEAEGRSVVLTRTPEGEAIVVEAAAAGRIEVSDLDVSEIARMQPYQARRKALVLSRLAAMALFGRPVPRFQRSELVRSALGTGIWANMRSFLGMARRVVLHRV
jgi:coenzyme F420 hydrogenase subunit beta